jgi:hypothetical protein
VFAVDFAMITLSLALSSLAAAAISDSAGPRASAFVLGGVAVAWAAVWWLLTRKVRRRPTFDDEPAAEPGPAG